MAKRKMADGTVLDERVIGLTFGPVDDEYEYYFPEETKKERLEKIEYIKDLICEFKEVGDVDSLKSAEEALELAESSYDNFIETVYKNKDRWGK